MGGKYDAGVGGASGPKGFNIVNSDRALRAGGHTATVPESDSSLSRTMISSFGSCGGTS